VRIHCGESFGLVHQSHIREHRTGMGFRREHVTAALTHLHAADPVMSALIERVGPFTLRAQRDRFGMLVRSIISQQISTKAARSIRRRLEELLAPDLLSAEALAGRTDDELRSVGLSVQKVRYLRDLSEHVLDGRLTLAAIGRRSDEVIITELVRVKGIGVWTAQMFLIFALGRLDVFPEADLGVRAALKTLYGLDALPTAAEARRLAEPWRPYATIASWYCWRSLDTVPK
jgi:DNA-3-methyladenine glycosylase II